MALSAASTRSAEHLAREEKSGDGDDRYRP